MGRLIRLGFTDIRRAASLLAAPPLASVIGIQQIDLLGLAADPDLALLSLSRILDMPESDDLRGQLSVDERSLAELVVVLGVSTAFADYLVRHPEMWMRLQESPQSLARGDLCTFLCQSVGADAASPIPTASGHGLDELNSLRIAYHQVLLQVAREDVAAHAPLEATSQALAYAADGVLEAALAIARSEVGPRSDATRLAIVAMGKCGGAELNYISDVDVVYVVRSESGDDADAVKWGTKLAKALMRACMASTIEGSIWEVDPALRPEGKSGALVRTLASHLGYYERWAQTWEFQALLKARASAGDLWLGQEYVNAVSELVWEASARADFVPDVQKMRRKVEKSIASKDASRELKLAPGGLRDVEFSVQLLQLVHGRLDQRLRSGNTLLALDALATHGYVGRTDAAELGSAYRFLRTLEHRVQMYRMKRTHLLPKGDNDLRRLARSVGMLKEPLVQLKKERESHSRDARRLHEKLFYRPLLNAVARLVPGEERLSKEAAGDRLRALGFSDPDSALGHLQVLTSGLSRRAAIQRTLLPVMLEWFASTPDPDAALLRFRKVSDDLGSTAWYLRMLRDESVVAERLAQLLGTSKYASDLLLRSPDGVSLLAKRVELEPRTRESLESEALVIVDRHDSPESAVRAVRGLRARELFRVAAGDSLRLTNTGDAAEGLTDLVSATIAGALHASVKAVTGPLEEERGIRFLVVAMGRFGGAELGYTSDADVMFIYEPTGRFSSRESGRQAIEIANEIRRLLAVPGKDPVLEIDATLRPEGRNGPMAKSMEAYRAYYSRWSSPWEAQALLRATPACGDHAMAEEFVEMIDPIRYPEGGLSNANLREMRRLKARMESERLPRGADPRTHTKMGPGGLSDVEWTIQLLQMQNAHEIPQLKISHTLPAIAAAREAGLLSEKDTNRLTQAWLIATRIRNAAMLVTGRPSDQVPTQPRTLASVAHILGYGQSNSEKLTDEYRRATRRSRKVVDRVFYGL